MSVALSQPAVDESQWVAHCSTICWRCFLVEAGLRMDRSSRSPSPGARKELRSPPRSRSPPRRSGSPIATKLGSESKRRSLSRSPPRRNDRSPPRRRSRSHSTSRSRERRRYTSGSRSRSGSRDRHGSSSRYDRDRSSRYDDRDRERYGSRRSSRSRDRDRDRYGGGDGSRWTSSSYRRPPIDDDRRAGGYDARARRPDVRDWRGGRSPPRADRYSHTQHIPRSTHNEVCADERLTGGTACLRCTV